MLSRIDVTITVYVVLRVGSTEYGVLLATPFIKYLAVDYQPRLVDHWRHLCTENCAPE